MAMATPEQLRELLLTPEQAAELDAAGGSTDAAVLVPLYLAGDDLVAVLTERRHDLRRHAGEISFPGGRQDFPDEDLRPTALREAEEEIGLPPDDVELVGALPPTGTFVTGYRIHPFVGLIGPGHCGAARSRGRAHPRGLAFAGKLGSRLEGEKAADPARRADQDPHLHRGRQPRLGRHRRIVQQLLERLEPLL